MDFLFVSDTTLCFSLVSSLTLLCLIYYIFSFILHIISLVPTMINFMYQLLWTTVSKCLLKHYSRCFCKDMFGWDLHWNPWILSKAHFYLFRLKTWLEQTADLPQQEEIFQQSSSSFPSGHIACKSLHLLNFCLSLWAHFAPKCVPLGSFFLQPPCQPFCTCRPERPEAINAHPSLEHAQRGEVWPWRRAPPLLDVTCSTGRIVRPGLWLQYQHLHSTPSQTPARPAPASMEEPALTHSHITFRIP